METTVPHIGKPQGPEIEDKIVQKRENDKKVIMKKYKSLPKNNSVNYQMLL